MQSSLRTFWITLIIGEALASIAGLTYAHELSIPPWPVLAAFLIELGFYLTLPFEEVRCALARRFRPTCLALLMTLSAVLPYCVYGHFRLPAFAALLGISAAVSFWYIVLPHRAIVDAGFLILLAAPLLGKLLPQIYTDAPPHVPAVLLGHLMLIRLGAMGALVFRRVGGVGFSFIPRRHDWSIGIAHFLYFLPVALLLSRWLDFATWHPRTLIWWKAVPLAIAIFFGILWMVALSEEFLFRGLLQQWLSNWMRSATAGLVAASLLFGSVHLSFRRFPNWRFAIIAAVAGFFFGRAYQKGGSICAPMVAHALLVTTWMMLFS